MIPFPGLLPGLDLILQSIWWLKDHFESKTCTCKVSLTHPSSMDLWDFLQILVRFPGLYVGLTFMSTFCGQGEWAQKFQKTKRNIVIEN